MRELACWPTIQGSLVQRRRTACPSVMLPLAPHATAAALTRGKPQRVAITMMMDVLNSTIKPRLEVCAAARSEQVGNNAREQRSGRTKQTQAAADRR